MGKCPMHDDRNQDVAQKGALDAATFREDGLKNQYHTVRAIRRSISGPDSTPEPQGGSTGGWQCK